MEFVRAKAWLTILQTTLLMTFMMLVAPAGAAFKYTHEGMIAPEVKGKDVLTGDAVSTSDLIKDNVVVVVFWAGWSGRSIEELKSLNSIREQYSEMPLKIVAVNVEGQQITADTRDTIAAITRNLELQYPVIIDNELELFYEYGVIAVPSTAILDQNGVLRYGPAGYSLTTRDLIDDSIKVLLGIEVQMAEDFGTTYRPDSKANRYYNLALNLSLRGMYERSIANLEQAIALDSLFAAPHSLLGEILLELDSVDAARDRFSMAISNDSNSVVALTGLAMTYYLSEQFDSAFDILSLALETDDTYTPAFLQLGLCLAAQGKVSEALDSLQKAKELNLRDPQIHYYIGKASYMKGDLAETVKSYIAALDILYPAR